MSITVEEKWNGRRQTLGDSPSQEVGYLIFGTDDDTLAQAAMLDYTPPLWGGMPIQTSEITDRLAEFLFEGLVKYAFQAPKEEGEETLSFDAKGSTSKITQSLSTRKYAVSGTAPDFKGAIGVTKDHVEGVEIPVPGLTFTKHKRFAAGYVTAAWIKAVSRLYGKTNAAPFFGFAVGEVRFDGAAGTQKKPSEPWDVDFNFAASENATGLTVATISGIQKDGWEYLWTLYQDEEDGSAKFLVKRPVAVYVEKVLQSGDFSILGISTGT